MSDGSAIEWTEATWNPVTGCTKVSPGCDNCYAERLARRLQAMGNPRYRNGFAVTLHADQVELPLRWRQPRMIFVNSMSDLFHDDVPDEFIVGVFRTMERAGWHTFQVLTKRPGRMASFLKRNQAQPLPNVWLGTSVEDQRWATVRIPKLLTVPAAVRFLSCEPLLGPVSLERWLRSRSIHWVIAGGESGPGHRPIQSRWVQGIRDECRATGVAFFFKQWGGRTSKAGGRTLDGRVWSQMPKVRDSRADVVAL